RQVAIKVLPEAFARDVDRMARFEREAQMLAALNHPNIASIYAIEQNALVMELVEGETLQGPLGLATAIDYARQIALALEAAQARGKPADRRVDIWAFGAVLFELLTGSVLFAGAETLSDSLAAVITKEPEWNRLPCETPPHIRRLLEQCLRKDPRMRLRDIGD